MGCVRCQIVELAVGTLTHKRVARVKRFLELAHVLCEPDHRLFCLARRKLPAATGLSKENVNWALDNALEVRPSTWDLDLLCNRTPKCNRAHVLLSANVFVAPLRAIAIAIAAAPEVYVRASRREPMAVELLAQAAPECFHIVDELRPHPSDHCWAYGHDDTLMQFRSSLSASVVFHAHGSGYGIGIVRADELRDNSCVDKLARAIAEDVAPFDQRGCLSPRVVLVEKSRELAWRLWQILAAAMSDRELQVPMGDISNHERSDIRRYRDTLCVGGEVMSAGSGLVSFETQDLPWVLPPIGRVVHIRTTHDAIQDARTHAASLTTVGLGSTDTSYAAALQAALPSVRIAKLGEMQRPKLDGPVDLRNLDGEIL